MLDIKNWIEVTNWGDWFYAQNEESKSFWPKLRLFNFSLNLLVRFFCNCTSWHRARYGDLRGGVVVITTAQLHSTKPELRFCAVSNPARGVSEIRNGENLWQWSRLEIRVDTFRRSTIPQRQFTIIIIIIIITHEEVLTCSKLRAHKSKYL